MNDHLIPNVLGKTPSLDDYEGTWDDVAGIERDDTYDDIDEIMEQGFRYGAGEE